ncbi:hypothetical protein KAR91_04715 [Candidatus Pacearchaeota archaeon]|nr:hypothetical protein [Candidatus Pacearchaeota archaeon]
MKTYKPVEWDEIEVGDELQHENSNNSHKRTVKVYSIDHRRVYYSKSSYNLREDLESRKARLSRLVEQEDGMIEQWVPVGADEIKVGDRLQIRVRVDKGDSDWKNIGTVKRLGDSGLETCRGYWHNERTFQRLVTDTDTEMYNMWDAEGSWQGAKKTTIRTPGWTYEKVTEYPSVPIKDGVYRVEFKENSGIWFLEMKNGEWLHSSGEQWQYSCDFTIIQKYREVKDDR